MHFSLLVQNSSKVSVKDRLGFSAKPAAPVEKVSVHYVQHYQFLFFSSSLSKCINVMCCNFTPPIRCFLHPWASQRLYTILLL